MKKIFILFFFLIAGSCLSDDIYFNFDYSVFRGEEGKSILEIYYSVNQASLKYVKTDNNFEAGAKIEISITDLSNNDVVISNVYKTPSVVNDTSKDNINQKLIGQLNYSLPNGKYKLVLNGSDFNDSTKEDTFEQQVEINSESYDKVSISDIELSTSIEKAKNDQSIFYKNTLDVIPNPSGLFGMNLNELHYYAELYGLSPENISDEFLMDYSVFNLNNEKVISHSKKVKRSAESRVDFGKIKVDSLKRGSYTFRVTISDTLKNVNVNSEKKFYIFNAVDNVTTFSGENDFPRSEYAAMSEENINDEFEKMEYVLSEQGKKTFEGLKSLDDKRKFLFNFWKSKDKNPSTPIFETKIDYFKRYNEANTTYKEAYKEGWKTDRGRIYIIYGKPDDIERFPFQAETKSYEIWKYNTVEGGGECVFVELQATTGNYWLVHSTFRNELRNDDWEKQLDAR